jgi:DNA-binding protein H-NS
MERMTSMAKTLTQINRQIEKLQRQADTLKQQEVTGVISRIKTAIDHYGLTAQDLGMTGTRAGAGSPRAARKLSARKATSIKKPALPVKFRDEEGHTWSGRGKRPNWFKAALESGKSPEDLAA